MFKYNTPFYFGAHYYLTLVGYFSRATWLYLITDKYDVFDYLTAFFAMIKAPFSCRVQHILSDLGTDLVSSQLLAYFRAHSIRHSCVGTQQNGRGQRERCHHLDMAQKLRFQAKLPIKFWGECLLTAAYSINYTPMSHLFDKSPYERLFQKPPTYHNLHVFGYLCYAYTDDHVHDKIGFGPSKCIFIGYPHVQKGWRVYDLNTCRIFISRRVEFHKTGFPFATLFTDCKIDYIWLLAFAY